MHVHSIAILRNLNSGGRGPPGDLGRRVNVYTTQVYIPRVEKKGYKHQESTVAEFEYKVRRPKSRPMNV
ncbi:hypothetical protein VTO73DRAFT_914 [Trametes versicolor]